MRSRLLLVALLALGVVGTTVPPALADGDDNPIYPFTEFNDSPNDNVVLIWNEAALECIRAAKPGPTIVARSLYVLHAAVYDAWSSYDSRAVPTVRSIAGVSTAWSRRPGAERTVANKQRAISVAAHAALTDLWPQDVPQCRAAFDRELADLGFTAATDRAAGVGLAAAQRVLRSRSTDGSNQAGGYADTSGYQPVNPPTPARATSPWRWQPLTVPFGSANATAQRALTPHWGDVRPFEPKLLETALQVEDPNEMSASEREAMIDRFLAESSNLTDREKVVAEYWADGPQSELPPGHWNLFAQWASRRWRQSLDTDVKMFFGLNGAMLDASIASWELKYRYDFARPITVVRTLRAGRTVPGWGGPVPAEQWSPYQPDSFPTPPFPAYTSGHSTFSYAAAAFLKDFGAVQGRDGDVFGASVVVPAGSTRREPGVAPRTDVTLSWASWNAAAQEAAISRRLGGIHWEIDDVPTRDLGKKIGEGAFSLAKKYWEGG
jgi:hypothetical protein